MDITNKRFLRSTLPMFLAAGLAGLAGCVSSTPQTAISLKQPAFPFERSFRGADLEASSRVDLVHVSYSIADALVAELYKGHPEFDPDVPILVTSFVNRSDLDATSELGLILADHVASRMTQRGYIVLEPKLRRDLSIRQEEGEFLLSRDTEKLHSENGAYAALVGSYTETSNVIDFTAKIVEIRDRKVLASVDVRLPMGKNFRDLLESTNNGTFLEVVAQ